MDARTRYTTLMIKQEFIGLLDKNHISKITVTNLCDKAQINRATFYKYYNNPYDLLSKIEAELLDNLAKRIEQAEHKSVTEILRIILQDMQENRKMYTVIFSQNGDVAFRERVFTLCYTHNMEYIKNNLPHLDKKHQEWLYFFMIEGCNGIINHWIGNNMEDDIDTIVAFTKKLGASLLDSCK